MLLQDHPSHPPRWRHHGQRNFRREDVPRETRTLVRPMSRADLEDVLELRNVVRWRAGSEAFSVLFKSIPAARWAVAEAPSGAMIGMAGAVPLGRIGGLCHLAVYPACRIEELGTRLASWAIAYMRFRGPPSSASTPRPKPRSSMRCIGSKWRIR